MRKFCSDAVQGEREATEASTARLLFAWLCSSPLSFGTSPETSCTTNMLRDAQMFPDDHTAAYAEWTWRKNTLTLNGERRNTE